MFTDRLKPVENWFIYTNAIAVVQSLSHDQLFATLCTSACPVPCPSPFPRLVSTLCPLSWWWHLTICHPLLLLPSFFPCITVFFNESALHITGLKCHYSAMKSHYLKYEIMPLVGVRMYFGGSNTKWSQAERGRQKNIISLTGNILEIYKGTNLKHKKRLWEIKHT